MKHVKMIIALTLAALLLEASSNARAQQEPSLQGKTVRVIVGFAAGGATDQSGASVA
jgi:tripartite-type tricarboxylate transporter receptor subunit TctC